MFHLTAGVDQWYEWTVRIRVKKFEYGESFSVLVFLGEVPHDPDQWMTAESFAGVHHVFAGMPGGDGDSDMINEGFIRVNRHLQHRVPGQKTYDPAVVKPFLKQNLNWRTTDVSIMHLLLLALTLTTSGVYRLLDTLLRLDLLRSRWSQCYTARIPVPTSQLQEKGFYTTILHTDALGVRPTALLIKPD